jgi:hypothetical protein
MPQSPRIWVISTRLDATSWCTQYPPRATVPLSASRSRVPSSISRMTQAARSALGVSRSRRRDHARGSTSITQSVPSACPRASADARIGRSQFLHTRLSRNVASFLASLTTSGSVARDGVLAEGIVERRLARVIHGSGSPPRA